VVGWWATVEIDIGERVWVAALEFHLDARPVHSLARRVVHPAVPVAQESTAEAIIDGGWSAMHYGRPPDRAEQRSHRPDRCPNAPARDSVRDGRKWDRETVGLPTTRGAPCAPRAALRRRTCHRLTPRSATMTA